jgi:hypothetical protein
MVPLRVVTAWAPTPASPEEAGAILDRELAAFRAQVAALERDPDELRPVFDVTTEDRAGGTEMRLIFEYPSRLRGAVP